MEHINLELTEELRFLEAYYAESKLEDIYWAEYDFSIKTAGADEKMAQDIKDILCAEQVIIIKKRKKDGKITVSETDIAPFVRDVSVALDGGEIKINLKLSASINQTHPHINPESLITMLKEKLGILSGDPLSEEYSIIRKRVYFEDAKTDFK